MIEIMQSIRPKWCELIIHGKKTIEVRKTRPKCGTPFKVYIYCTKPTKWFTVLHFCASNENLWLSEGKVNMSDGFEHWASNKPYTCLNGKVIGEYICDEVLEYPYIDDGYSSGGDYLTITRDGYIKMCLDHADLLTYGGGKTLYGWHISDLKIYDTPKDIREFKRVNRTEENTPCAHVKWLYEPCEKCKECNLTRAPQSWCYVQRIWE